MRPRLDQNQHADPTDCAILMLLQANCQMSLAAIGEKVGLSAPSVLERIKKLEAVGVIRGYEAVLDARRLGLDITAFLGITISHPNFIEPFLAHLASLDSVQESHQVTGSYTVLVKVKTENTSTLGELISGINRIEGVTRSETTVVLSTHTERSAIVIHQPAPTRARRARRGNGEPVAVDEEIPGKD